MRISLFLITLFFSTSLCAQTSADSVQQVISDFFLGMKTADTARMRAA
ncbi:MAG: hypothetical protein RLZZ256_900, partial [Bacteroidota bacterium]